MNLLKPILQFALTLIISIALVAPVAADPAKTPIFITQTDVVQIAPATVEQTGNVTHWYGATFLASLSSTDPRVEGSMVIVYEQCTRQVDSFWGPCQGSFLLTTALDPTSGWEGSWTSQPYANEGVLNRTTAKGQGRGFGQYDRMRVELDFSITPDHPVGIYHGHIIENGRGNAP